MMEMQREMAKRSRRDRSRGRRLGDGRLVWMNIENPKGNGSQLGRMNIENAKGNGSQRSRRGRSRARNGS